MLQEISHAEQVYMRERGVFVHLDTTIIPFIEKISRMWENPIRCL